MEGVRDSESKSFFMMEPLRLPAEKPRGCRPINPELGSDHKGAMRMCSSARRLRG